MNQTETVAVNQGIKTTGKYRWSICALLFFATTINYLDRQVLSLTWSDFIAPEFHWTNNDYGNITALFSIFYAVSLLFAGRFVDWLDTKKGFLWAIGIWSVGACLHAFCGIATSGIITGEWFVGFHGSKEIISTVSDTALVINVSVALFIFARFVLAVGEAGNFPAAIKTTAEYFPKKDRAFATSIFNAGATVGALAAPITIPFIAKSFGWEMSFIIIGALGFVWMGFWMFMYDKPERHSKVTSEELAYIQQDDIADSKLVGFVPETSTKVSLADCFKYKQTWAFAFGKFMTDGVWWFFLFWTPAYLSSVYGMDSTEASIPIICTLFNYIIINYRRLATNLFCREKRNESLRRKNESDVDFCFFSIVGLNRAAIRIYQLLGSSNHYRNCWCGTPILVGKYFYNSRRYVS